MLGGVYWLGVSANTNSVPIVVLTVSADGWPIPKEDIFSMVKNEFSGLQVGDLLYLCRVGSLVGAVFEVQVIKAKTLQVVCLENGNEHIKTAKNAPADCHRHQTTQRQQRHPTPGRSYPHQHVKLLGRRQPFQRNLAENLIIVGHGFAFLSRVWAR